MMLTIKPEDIKPGMKFRNVFGEINSTIEIVDVEKAVIKSAQPYYGYTGAFYWFAMSHIQVLYEDNWCYVEGVK